MSNWNYKKLEEVCDVRDGTHDSPKYHEKGIPFITSKNLSPSGIDFTDISFISQENHKQFSQRSKVDKGDILFGMIGTVGNPVLINFDLEFSIKNVALLKFGQSKELFNEFAIQVLKSNIILDQFRSKSDGGVQAFVSLTTIRNLDFPVPLIPEQRQIATILSTADAVIEKTQAAIAKYKAIKQGLLQDLFTRGIDTTTGKLRPSYQDEPELYKVSKLGWIPKDWNEEIFGEQIELVHGHQFRNYDFTEFGVAVVKIGQVKPENVDLSNCSFVSADRMEEFRNETIRNGDVLMALTGATLGKACLVSGLSNPVLQNYRVGRFEPKIKENDIDKSFLYYTLTAGELLNQIFNKVNSGAQGNIGKADFEKALFKKPPFTEQKLIAERLNSLNKKLQTEQDFLHKQQQIKAGLMNDLLSGKKKVTIKVNQMA